jgi:hypothetical protein
MKSLRHLVELTVASWALASFVGDPRTASFTDIRDRN